MGSVGDCYDNALCESFFATLECELIERRRFGNRMEAKMAVFRRKTQTLTCPLNRGRFILCVLRVSRTLGQSAKCAIFDGHMCAILEGR